MEGGFYLKSYKVLIFFKDFYEIIPSTKFFQAQLSDEGPSCKQGLS